MTYLEAREFEARDLVRVCGTASAAKEKLNEDHAGLISLYESGNREPWVSFAYKDYVTIHGFLSQMEVD